jgi:hypothetical protein
MNLGHHPLADRQVFRRRLIGTGRIGLGLIALSLAIGIAGYAITEQLSLVDAFLNASMILSGMGPLHEPKTVAGKIFSGLYALYSGFAVLGIAAIVFSPVVHRLFHRFHIADTDEDPRT